MEIALLLQSINENIQRVNGQIGDIREFQGRTVSRVEDIAKDVTDVVQLYNSLCIQVREHDDYIKAQKIGAKTTSIIIGIVAGSLGAVGGALSIVLILYQLGSMMGGVP